MGETRGAAQPREERTAKPSAEHARTVSLEPFPKEIARRERLAVAHRRKVAKVLPLVHLDGGDKAREKFNPPRIGIAVSGGGIRSATFALGFFQSLARAGLLKHVDYLSTVSGGGYFGSFLGALFVRKGATKPEDAPEAVEAILKSDTDPTIRYLRDNGAYLAPGGSADLMLGGTVLLRNWIAVQFVLLSLVLLAFVGAHTLELAALSQIPSWPKAWARVEGYCALRGVWISPWFSLPPALLVLAGIPLGGAYWTISRDRLPKYFGDAQKWAGATWMAAPHIAVAGGAIVATWSGILGDGVLSVCALCVAWIATLALSTAFVASCKEVWAIWLPYAVGTIGIASAFFLNRPADLEDLSLYHALPFLALLVLLGVSGITRAARPDSELSADSFARNRVSTGLRTILLLVGATLAFATLDTIGRTLYVALAGDWGAVMGVSGGFSGFLLFLSAFGRKIALRRANDESPPGAPGLIALWVAALTLIVIIASAASFSSQALLWNSGASALAPKIKTPDFIVSRQTLIDRSEANSAKVELVVEVPRPGAAPRPPESHEADIPVETLKPKVTSADLFPAFWTFGLLFVICVLLGSSRAFLNRSTHLPLYSSRLIRAYLGASNPRRLTEGRGNLKAATVVIPGDDIGAVSYFGWGWNGKGDPPEGTHYGSGAPLHIVNVTINETVDGSTQLTNKSRRGLGLAVGPCAFSAGVRHHLLAGKSPGISDAKAGGAHRVFTFGDLPAPAAYPEEPLSLGQWMSISGAAFSTGLGSRTSAATSFLAGFANVRLGYWWRPGIEWKRTPSRFLGALIWVQTYLFREFFARFPGTQNSLWYLTDGGHFENMGGYELIRRRLPFIIVIDAEADEKYQFEGLGNFVRKARLDFGAEIEFVENPLEQLEPEVAPVGKAEDGTEQSSVPIGPLEQLRRGNWTLDSSKNGDSWSFELSETGGRSRVRAALAKVSYSDEPGEPARWLLYVKPTLLEGMPADLLQYSNEHVAFPHEPTVDQFFDEAQWESYRKLGELSGAELFPALATQNSSPLGDMIRGTHPLMKALREAVPKDDAQPHSAASPPGAMD